MPSTLLPAVSPDRPWVAGIVIGVLAPLVFLAILAALSAAVPS